MRQKGRCFWIGIIFIAVFSLFLGGCANSKYKFSRRSYTSEKASTPERKGSSPLYYDFGDVLIPSEMKVDKKNSFIYRTPGFSAGLLTVKGRVEMNSLITFFDNNMAKDNWRQLSSFKSPRTIMLYQKDNRWCVISITERDFTTVAEIWVAPTMERGQQIHYNEELLK